MNHRPPFRQLLFLLRLTLFEAHLLRVQSSSGLTGTSAEWQEDPPQASPHVSPKTLTSAVPRGWSPTAGISHLKETRHQKKQRAACARLQGGGDGGRSMCRSSTAPAASFDSALVFHHLQTFIKGPLILENSIMASKMDKLAAGAEKLTRRPGEKKNVLALI